MQRSSGRKTLPRLPHVSFGLTGSWPESAFREAPSRPTVDYWHEILPAKNRLNLISVWWGGRLDRALALKQAVSLMNRWCDALSPGIGFGPVSGRHSPIQTGPGDVSNYRVAREN